MLMKIRALLPCSFLLLVGISAFAQSEPTSPTHYDVPEGQDCSQAVTNVLSILDSVHPGNTRARVEQTFTEDGGIQTRSQTRYTFKQCHYIKINVEFSYTDNHPADFSPDDKIVKISKPYIELPVAD
jgi:hypothetical protein